MCPSKLCTAARPRVGHGFRILSSKSSLIEVLGNQNTNDHIIQQRSTQKKRKRPRFYGGGTKRGSPSKGHWGYKSDHDGLSNPCDDPRVYIEVFSSMKYIFIARCSTQRSDDTRRLQSNKAWLTHMSEL